MQEKLGYGAMLENGLLACGFDEIESLLCGTLLWRWNWFGRGVEGTVEPGDIRVLEPEQGAGCERVGAIRSRREGKKKTVQSTVERPWPSSNV